MCHVFNVVLVDFGRNIRGNVPEGRISRVAVGTVSSRALCLNSLSLGAAGFFTTLRFCSDPADAVQEPTKLDYPHAVCETGDED